MPLSLVLLFVFIGPWIALTIVAFFQWRRSDRETSSFMKSMAEQDARINKQIADNSGRVNAAILEFRELTIKQSEGQKERFEAVVRMYENNVEMVRDYNRLADDLTGVITLTTRTLEALVQKVDNNMFCPAVREKGGK